MEGPDPTPLLGTEKGMLDNTVFIKYMQFNIKYKSPRRLNVTERGQMWPTVTWPLLAADFKALCRSGCHYASEQARRASWFALRCRGLLVCPKVQRPPGLP